jgi:hypothetical protein
VDHKKIEVSQYQKDSLFYEIIITKQWMLEINLSQKKTLLNTQVDINVDA